MRTSRLALAGDGSYRMMKHHCDDLGYQLEGFELSLANGEGTWIGPSTGIFARTDDAEYGNVFTTTLDGAGAYEGLTAYLTWDGGTTSDGDAFILRGMILGEGMPPLPETGS